MGFGTGAQPEWRILLEDMPNMHGLRLSRINTLARCLLRWQVALRQWLGSQGYV